MWNNKDYKIAILYSVILFFVSIFLISTCIRLLYSILHTFIYLSGLITTVIFILIFLAIIGFLIRHILGAVFHHKRTFVSKLDILNLIISIEIHTIEGLLVVISILFGISLFT